MKEWKGKECGEVRLEQAEKFAALNWGCLALQIVGSPADASRPPAAYVSKHLVNMDNPFVFNHTMTGTWKKFPCSASDSLQPEMIYYIDRLPCSISIAVLFTFPQTNLGMECRSLSRPLIRVVRCAGDACHGTV